MTPLFRMTRIMRLGTALLERLLRSAIPMGSLMLLAVLGRMSSKVYTTPVALVKQGHERWLVAAFGDVNWVRNLRAAGTAHLIRGRHAEPIRASELETSAAAPVLRQFLRAYHLIPFIAPYFRVTSQAPLDAFEQEAAHHPVFHIEEAQAANKRGDGSSNRGYSHQSTSARQRPSLRWSIGSKRQRSQLRAVVPCIDGKMSRLAPARSGRLNERRAADCQRGPQRPYLASALPVPAMSGRDEAAYELGTRMEWSRRPQTRQRRSRSTPTRARHGRR